MADDIMMILPTLTEQPEATTSKRTVKQKRSREKAVVEQPPEPEFGGRTIYAQDPLCYYAVSENKKTGCILYHTAEFTDYEDFGPDIANDQLVRVPIDLGEPGILMLNPDAIDRASAEMEMPSIIRSMASAPQECRLFKSTTQLVINNKPYACLVVARSRADALVMLRRQLADLGSGVDSNTVGSVQVKAIPTTGAYGDIIFDVVKEQHETRGTSKKVPRWSFGDSDRQQNTSKRSRVNVDDYI